MLMHQCQRRLPRTDTMQACTVLRWVERPSIAAFWAASLVVGMVEGRDIVRNEDEWAPL